MKILVYCPLSPQPPIIHPKALASILAIHWMEPLDIVLGRADSYKWPDRPLAYADITRKYNQAREMMLRGGYDALLTVESDMIIPPLALERLSRVEADIVYALYVSRHGARPWLAFSRITGNGKYTGASFSKSPELCKAAWGSVVDSAGLGLGCTLIHRRVLEQIEFRCPDGQVANDWHFALDATAAGFRQVHDCGTVCGHIDDDIAYYPTEDGGWRAEEVLWPT